MRFAIVCNSDGALYVFRGDLIRALVASGNEVVAVCPRGQYQTKIEDLGCEFVPIEVARHAIGITSNLREIVNIAKVLRRSRIDVVHAFAHKAVIYSAIACRAIGIRRVFGTVTGLGWAYSVNSWRAIVVRIAISLGYIVASRLVETLFFQNEDDLRLFVDWQICPRSRAVRVYGSAIDTDKFVPPAGYRKALVRQELGPMLGGEVDEKIIVVLLARAIPEKGVDLFYGAARKVTATSGKYLFAHAGLAEGGSNGEFSEGHIRATAESSQVKYLGYLIDPWKLIEAADIVVLPSRYREGVPRSLIEAMALGKAIITSDTPGCRDTVKEGVNGYLVRPLSEEELANTILKVDAVAAQALGAASRALAMEKFSIKDLVRVTFERYFRTA